VDLSIVNELDVFEQDPSMADKYGAYFRSLFAAWAPTASQQVTGQVQRLISQ